MMMFQRKLLLMKSGQNFLKKSSTKQLLELKISKSSKPNCRSNSCEEPSRGLKLCSTRCEENQKVKKFLTDINRYRRICTKVDVSIFDSALSRTRRSEAPKKKMKILASTATSFESSLVSVNNFYLNTLNYVTSIKF